jgi:glycosyltransferase involved in cell wall biosynthesis
MNVLYAYDGDWPRAAVRVAKETRSIARAGHVVHLLARNGSRAPREEREPWMTVHRLPCVRTNWINYAINFPFFGNPLWIWETLRTAKDMRADCLLVCDLPLAPVALWVGRRLDIPVCYDMAEVYPEFLRSQWETQPMAWSDYLVRNPAAAAWVERRVLPAFRSVFVVSEESRQRCVRLGVTPDRVVIVGNTPEDVETLGSPQPMPADLEPWKDRQRLLFVGTLIADRGVVSAIEAMALVVHRMPNAVLIIVGDGPDRPVIEAAVARAGLARHVALLGWRDPSTLPAYYRHAEIGLLPFRDTPHIRVTLANKLFDYMAAGLPLVAVDVPPMRRIISETRAGVLYPPGDTRALADGIVGLLGAPAHRATLGMNGRRAVVERYCWQIDEVRLLEALGCLGPLGARQMASDPARNSLAAS